MSKLKVYISSTYLDTSSVRNSVMDVIQRKLYPYFEFTEIMELMWGDGGNRPSIDICLENVRAANVYILLIGNRYGASPPRYRNGAGEIIENTDGKSYTQLEYEAALEEKRTKAYHIYKLQIPQSLLMDSTVDHENADKFQRFRSLLGETNFTRIKDGEDLRTTLYGLLTKSDMEFRTPQSLNISEEDKRSIDRKRQITELDTFAKLLDIDSVAPVFVFSTENTAEDETDRFSIKVKEMLRTSGTLTKINYWVGSNDIANILASDENQVMEMILRASSTNITKNGQRGRFNFATLNSFIKSEAVDNRYLGFVIDLRTDEEEVEKFIDYVKKFILKIEDYPYEAFFYSFYFVICVIGSEYEADEFTDKHLSGFGNVRRDLGRLGKVSLDDVKSWLEDVVSVKNEDFRQKFIQDRENMITQIFSDTKSFPKTYKRCLQDIDTRITPK